MARKKRTSKEENQLAKTKSAKIKSAKTRKFSREQVKKREDILAAGTEESALETLASQVRALSARHQAILRKRRNHCMLGNEIFECKSDLLKVSEAMRAHPWWKGSAGNMAPLKNSIRLLRNRMNKVCR